MKPELLKKLSKFKDGREFMDWFVKHPSFMRSEAFIINKQKQADLGEVILEMGPNCNLACSHCSLECGPKRNGLPNLETTVKLLDEACRLKIDSVVLTAGEPLRDENKSIMRAVSIYSKYLRPLIVTNGTFAHSFESAVEWFEFMRENGLDFSRRGMLEVSVGPTYAVPLTNYVNINLALKRVYPNAEWGEFLVYNQLNIGDRKANVAKIFQMDNVFESTFSVNGDAKATRDERGNPVFEIYLNGKKKPLEFAIQSCAVKGRAVGLDWTGEPDEKETKIQPQDMYLIEVQDPIGIEAGFDGNISFTDCREINRERRYGNINNESLPVILGRIRADPFYQGFKLGGLPLLYYVAQQANPGMVVIGRTGQDVSKMVRGDLDLAENVREYLRKEGVVAVYKQFIDTIDFRRRQNVGL